VLNTVPGSDFDFFESKGEGWPVNGCQCYICDKFIKDNFIILAILASGKK
jgi:hypothetical protein